MVFIANLDITVNSIEQKDTEARKFNFLKYKKFLVLVLEGSVFRIMRMFLLKYKSFLRLELENSVFQKYEKLFKSGFFIF